MDFTSQLQAYREQIERGLDKLVPAAGTRPARLHAAMRYSLQAGGKRLRPVLVLAAADLFRGSAAKSKIESNPQGLGHHKSKIGDALPAAIALECLHTYSLIHDDLPCMDNDDLRRGRPTAHKQFDEATALLAGDALLTLAFQLIARHYPAKTAHALTRELADAAGSERLIGGQMEDLLAEKKADATAAELEFIHLNKTAAILTAALVAGGICGGANNKQLATLREAGRHLGLAFQIIDDILDATADTKTLGKTAGKDAKSGKTTYVKVHGLDASRRHAREQSDAAKSTLARLSGAESSKAGGKAPFLTTLVENMAKRSM